ncbi:fiber [Simian adenovirus DM-2014]|uniref:Fiber n=1 Tax=Simian adenovirus DM-2014 TaxID=1560346 RepID=A0A097IWB0_9ADEN|nr:fiber [Simian adenovirus DM-2014]AIT70995.1 fiber [Simian adenovirus DM-2014]
MFILQMKRARAVTEDFNPVYPYNTPANGTTVPFTTPPFISSEGFKETPPGTLSLNYQSPLSVTNNQLSLKIGKGLSLSSEGQLQTTNLTSPPLSNINNTLQLSYTDGLTLLQNALAVNLGEGLAFNNKKITLDPLTLWTGPAAEPNAVVLPTGGSSTTYNACVTLSLTKVGPLVYGTISLIGIGAPLTPLAANVNSVKLSLTFDNNGELTGPDLDADNFGIRLGNTIDSTSQVNKVQFMPNVTTYPYNTEGAAGAGHYISAPGLVNTDSGKPCLLIVSLNTLVSTGFSLTFEWTGLLNYNVTLGTSTFFFSYLSQTQ